MTSINPHLTLLLNISEGSIYEHLALEDYLFAHKIPAFLIYISDPVVVIGKHQNPWLETDPHKYPFARRQSGGGSVYHDRGNVNYSFILPKDNYQREVIFSGVCNALEFLNIHTEISPAFALFTAGKKISGSAFRQNSRMVLHHGTLLVHTNLDQMKKSLSSPYTIMDTKSTRSNPSEVINLRELHPDLTTSGIIEALKNAFKNHYTLETPDSFSFIINSEELVKLIEFHKSAAWRFGDTVSRTKMIDINPYHLEGIHEKAGLSQ